MKIRQLSLAILSASLFGCALLGPKYAEPQLNNPQSWNSKDSTTVIESANLPDLAWWHQFNDKQLNQLIESALSNNNNLQMAMGNLLQAQAALHRVQMNWVPMINLGGVGFVGQSMNPSFQSLGPSTAALSSFQPNDPQNFNGYAAGFMPSYTLNVFSQIKQGEIAKLNVALQQASINAVRLAVIAQVTGSYFALLGLQKQLELQQQMIAEAEEMRKYNVIQYKEGSTSSINITALDQYIAGLQAKIPDLQNNITQVQNTIRLLINENPGKVITQNNFDNISTAGIIPVNLPSSVLKARPDIVAAEYQLQLSNANIGAVTSQFFPTISLTGALGQDSIQLANLFNLGGDFWAGQLGAGIPLLNLGLYARIDEAKAGYYGAYYNYIQTVRNVFAQVDNGLANHDNLNQVYQEQRIALDKAEELYQFAQKQYKAGATSYANTVGLRLNITYAQANLNQIKMQQMNSIIGLYQALGGGYNVESSLTKIKKFVDKHDI